MWAEWGKNHDLNHIFPSFKPFDCVLLPLGSRSKSINTAYMTLRILNTASASAPVSSSGSFSRVLQGDYQFEGTPRVSRWKGQGMS